MEWLIGYIVINLIMAVLVYGLWNKVERIIDTDTVYLMYRRQTIRLSVTLLYLFCGVPFMILVIISGLVKFIRSYL